MTDTIEGSNALTDGIAEAGAALARQRAGITTASGGEWHAMQVHRVRQRLGA